MTLGMNAELAERFEEHRTHLRAEAYRMLGSLSEADDAIQEAWLRLSRSDAQAIENLRGWLTTVVARVCLDMLRSRTSRREEPLDGQEPLPVGRNESSPDPEDEALMAESVGLALMVVLDRLSPAGRLAFVLHDMYSFPFEEIAPILGRTAEATRQLASRARRRVQGGDSVPSAVLSQQREVVNHFLTALRAGDLNGIIAVLDPDVVFRTDVPGRPGGPTEIHGAETWAKGAITFSKAAAFIQPALVDGDVGLLWAPGGRLLRALKFSITNGKITHVDVVGAPARLRDLNIALLEGWQPGAKGAPPVVNQ